MLAASSMSCANSPAQSNANVLAPTDLAAARVGGKPGTGGGGGGSLTYRMVTDNNNDGVPNFRDTVTFVVQTTATAYPYVTLKCKQNGTLVLQESNGIFPTSLSREFTLGPTSLWTGGTADCTATLEDWDSYSKHGSITVLASMSFTVN
jgi:hypothetical protein